MRYLIQLLIITLFISCNDAPNSTKSSNEPTVVIPDTIGYLRKLVAHSMRLESPDMVVYDSIQKSFVVDGDGIVTLEDAIERFKVELNGEVQGQASGTTQMVSAYKVNTKQYPVVKIYADATVPQVWLDALDSAIMHHNRAGYGIRFLRQDYPSGATTKVTAKNMAGSTVATAAYPDYYGRPGNKITINLYQNRLLESQKIFAAVHELSHTIGFSHTNGTYGYLVQETPVRDPRSVMNSVVADWYGFSNYDLRAIRNVYPSTSNNQ